jgi:hypothetical protein
MRLDEDFAPGGVPDVPVFRGGTGLRPGIDSRSNRALLETLDKDVDLNDRQ